MEVSAVGKHVSIDEAMIPFKGRSALKQYLPLKPIKRGFKVWVLADSVTGYASKFEVYTGKKGNAVEEKLGEEAIKSLQRKVMYKQLYYTYSFIGTITCILITLFQVLIFQWISGEMVCIVVEL